MLTDTGTFIALIVAAIVCLSLITIIRTNIKKSRLKSAFLFLASMMLIICIGVIAQNLLSIPLGIDPIYFEYFVYIGNVFFPIGFLLVGLIFNNSKVKLKHTKLLFVIPIISLLLLWTNDYHHLFYENYSIRADKMVYGPYVSIQMIYTYGLIFIGVINLLKYSIKNAGFFSRQSTLIILGVSIPIVINILGTFNIIPMTIYITPITFSFTLLCFATAIFKFKFLSITPIAMQRIVDNISDSFLVINENGVITDFNATFLKTFNLKSENVRNKDFINFFTSKNLEGIDKKFITSILNKCESTQETILVKQEMKIGDNYFNIEASGIYSKNTFLGTLILLKDVTQHMQDMETIKDNQNILMERERLASLGQMIGGIAHNLKTPIFSVSGGLEGLSDLIKEYDESIDDDTVTNEDMHEIAKDMKNWITKLREHISYMSEVITTVKGQAVTMSEEQNILFPVSELFQHIHILMQHELNQNLATLNITNNTPENVNIKGNINSLVQVINNLISNSMEAYELSNHEKIIDLSASYDNINKNIIISVKDYGPGLPKKVQEKLFKEMITTKGKNGTGLGLFMSYSNIKAHFNGDMTFETKENKGTTFNIKIPVG